MPKNTGSKRAARKRKGSPTPSTSLPSLDGPGMMLARDLRSARCASFHSRRAVAAELQLPVRLITEWERGVTAPFPSMLVKLADLYGVPDERFAPVTPSEELTR